MLYNGTVTQTLKPLAAQMHRILSMCAEMLCRACSQSLHHPPSTT